jgi:WD40 repeat protein
VYVLDLKFGNDKYMKYALKGHQGAATCVAFTGQTNGIISGGADGTLRIWGMPDS